MDDVGVKFHASIYAFTLWVKLSLRVNIAQKFFIYSYESTIKVKSKMAQLLLNQFIWKK